LSPGMCLSKRHNPSLHLFPTRKPREVCCVQGSSHDVSVVDWRVGSVEVGTKLFVRVRLHDCGTRFPLQRRVPVYVKKLSRDGQEQVETSVQMEYVSESSAVLERNLFEALLPASWLSSVGIVDLAVSDVGGSNTTNSVYLTLVVAPASSLSIQVIAGILIAGLFASLLAVLLRFIRRDPRHAFELVKSYATYELLLGVEVAFEVWDIFSDGVTVTIVWSDPSPAVRDLAVGYVVVFCVSLVSSVLIMAQQIKMIVSKIRKRKWSRKSRSRGARR
jgi:hypothetical protein